MLCSVPKQVGREHQLLGRQKLCYSIIIEPYRSPHCILFCFMSLPNVEIQLSKLSKLLTSSIMLFDLVKNLTRNIKLLLRC